MLVDADPKRIGFKSLAASDSPNRPVIVNSGIFFLDRAGSSNQLAQQFSTANSVALDALLIDL